MYLIHLVFIHVKLAVSFYHRSDDLWFQLIDSVNPFISSLMFVYCVSFFYSYSLTFVIVQDKI